MAGPPGGAASGTVGALAAGDPVPQMGEQLPNIVQFFAVQLPVVAEPVIEVPKVSQDRTSQRLGDCLRQPQMADKLVDVPTVVSYSSLQQLTAEQIVDIPALGRAGGGGRGGLQGLLPGQNSVASLVEQTVDIPVPRSGGLQGSRPGQGSAASSSHVGAADDAGLGVFRTFPQGKNSAGFGPHSGSELGADFNPWTPAATAESMAGAGDEFEAESEAEVEEGAVTRFAAGFRPLRVCMPFLEHQMGRPVWACAYGDRCTFAH